MEVSHPRVHPSAYPGADPDPDPEPATIAIALQPTPRITSLAVTPDGRWSSLVRHWDEGETARCRLCPNSPCRAEENVCHFLVPRTLTDREAPLYRRTT